jgi:hypothetical protein
VSLSRGYAVLMCLGLLGLLPAATALGQPSPPLLAHLELLSDPGPAPAVMAPDADNADADNAGADNAGADNAGVDDAGIPRCGRPMGAGCLRTPAGLTATRIARPSC